MSRVAATFSGRRPGTARTRSGLVALGLVAALALGACGGSGDDDDAGSPGASSDATSDTGSGSASETASDTESGSESGSESETGSADPEPYLPVPASVTLTDPGTRLYLGRKATVAWRPRKGEVAVLQLRVMSVERTTFARSFRGWKIDKATARLTPFFVRARAVNPLRRNLGGTDVLLWARDDEGTLVEAQRFREKVFEPCPGATLPKPFRQGDSASVCLVYLLSPGRRFDAVVFPPPDGVAPIVWKGQPPAKR
ncbi:hypothetical protein E8D34_14020 [Nocardioides sp. GY 10113]|uniref:hypothetical protein n=1 Tax=Nocardioides sp. GY 10113 TaxID=2569761 RepID=UPI0010A91F43|nr:hypothetical protein [Nocardioides sp. GY 10113]TIC84828.1 hypothetical protein E8D34_14020 [Nocardioides sp. GY 10113]